MIIMIFQIKKKFTKGIFKFTGVDYDFDDWDRNAQIDGWVCRNDADCTWIDENLGCDDRDFNLLDITVSSVKTIVVIMLFPKIKLLLTKLCHLQSVSPLGRLAKFFQKRIKRTLCLSI